MIISPKYKFIFFAATKTGSSSIQKALSNLDDVELIVGDRVPKQQTNLLHSKHTSCAELIQEYPNLNDYFKFAYARNPWSRTLSWYMYSKKSDREGRNTTNMCFNEFLQTRTWIWAGENEFQYKFTQCCDFVGRTETIQKDLNTVCDMIGIPRQVVPHKNKSTHEHYTEYYDDHSRKIVEDMFIEDIEHFDFKYGS